MGVVFLTGDVFLTGEWWVFLTWGVFLTGGVFKLFFDRGSGLTLIKEKKKVCVEEVNLVHFNFASFDKNYVPPRRSRRKTPQNDTGLHDPEQSS